jgi:hypothetical protein
MYHCRFAYVKQYFIGATPQAIGSPCPPAVSRAAACSGSSNTGKKTLWFCELFAQKMAKTAPKRGKTAPFYDKTAQKKQKTIWFLAKTRAFPPKTV